MSAETPNACRYPALPTCLNAESASRPPRLRRRRWWSHGMARSTSPGRKIRALPGVAPFGTAVASEYQENQTKNKNTRRAVWLRHGSHSQTQVEWRLLAALFAAGATNTMQNRKIKNDGQVVQSGRFADAVTDQSFGHQKRHTHV